MLTRLKNLMRRWLLPKIDEGMTDGELYKKVRALTGDHSFSIDRKITRHANHMDGPDRPPRIMEPTVTIWITVFEYDSIRAQVYAGSNGQAFAALELELVGREIKHHGPASAEMVGL